MTDLNATASTAITGLEVKIDESSTTKKITNHTNMRSGAIDFDAESNETRETIHSNTSPLVSNIKGKNYEKNVGANSPIVKSGTCGTGNEVFDQAETASCDSSKSSKTNFSDVQSNTYDGFTQHAYDGMRSLWTISSKILGSSPTHEIKASEKSPNKAAKICKNKDDVLLTEKPTTCITEKKSKESNKEGNNYDVTQHAYAGAKSIWLFGSTLPFAKPIFQVTKNTASKVLKISTGLELSNADEEIVPHLALIDSGYINPAITKIISTISPILESSDAMFRPVVHSIIPKLVSPVTSHLVKLYEERKVVNDIVKDQNKEEKSSASAVRDGTLPITVAL